MAALVVSALETTEMCCTAGCLVGLIVGVVVCSLCTGVLHLALSSLEDGKWHFSTSVIIWVGTGAVHVIMMYLYLGRDQARVGTIKVAMDESGNDFIIIIII